jgi:hypothetical protein
MANPMVLDFFNESSMAKLLRLVEDDTAAVLKLRFSLPGGVELSVAKTQHQTKKPGLRRA